MQKKAVALLLNDIHVGKDTIEDFKLNWKEAINTAIENQVNNIIVGGDLFLSRSSQTLDILLAVYDAFQECLDNNIKVVLIEGNHDLTDQEAIRGYCHIFGSFDNVIVVDDYMELSFPDKLRLGLISYFPENGSFCDKLDSLEEYFETIDCKNRILYIHQGIRGALSHPTDDELPAKIFNYWDRVLVGHYHNRCKFENIEYIGSSRQHNFGEDEEKGYTLLYSDGTVEFVKNMINVRYKVIEVSFDGINSHIKEEIETLTDNGYRVKVKVNCTPEQSKSIDKQFLLNAGVSKVEIIQSNILAVKSRQDDFNKRFDKEGIKSSYKGFCKSNKIEDIDLGIEYLNKIK